MLAKSVKGIPDPAKFGGLSFEPKWDGFRCIVFRDGDEVELTSRNTKPLTRYFPDLVEAVRRQLPERCVLDGEVFVAIEDRLEFEVLQERIHPAKSRVDMLSEKTPAGFVAFDLLALGDESYADRPFRERRAALEHVGVAASFTETRRAELIEELKPLVCPIEDHPWGHWSEFLTANPDRVPGTQSRWSQGKDLSFTPLRPERVLEVGYEHMEGRRFRHTAQFKRWRPDRDPESCGYGQLEEVASYDLGEVLGGG
jgi:ATP-dependent DNA ligase